ncbi:hypothetical protein QBC39DRAFT_37973 [Podospora conica]|nr:hypothetical protein QBC39DRAFT_37973 [Schizothecium conicum]
MDVAAADWIPAGGSALVAMYHRMPESLLWLAVGASHGKILSVWLFCAARRLPSRPLLVSNLHRTSCPSRIGMQLAFKHPPASTTLPASQPPSRGTSSLERHEKCRRPAQPAKHVSRLPLMIPSQASRPKPEQGRESGGVRDQTFCGTGSCGCSSSHIEGGEGGYARSSRNNCPRRQSRFELERVFVQSATQILFLCSIHDRSDSIPSLLLPFRPGPWPQRFGPTGQGHDKPSTPGRRQSVPKPTPKLPHPLLDPSVGARAHAEMLRVEWPADVLEELLIVPSRDGWFGCACSHGHQATPLSRPEPANQLLSPSCYSPPRALLASQAATRGLG